MKNREFIITITIICFALGLMLTMQLKTVKKNKEETASIRTSEVQTQYAELKKNKVEAVIDDRDAKAGFKFKDWELMGIPYMVVVGKRAPEGVVEFKDRHANTKEEVTPLDAVNKVLELVKNI